MKFANASLCSFMLGCFVCATAQAQEPHELFNQPPTGKAEGAQFVQKSEAVVVSQPGDDAPYRVRCWQNGILIVDDVNWRSPQMQTRYVSMKPQGGGEPGLYMVDFYSTFCELKKL